MATANKRTGRQPPSKKEGERKQFGWSRKKLITVVVSAISLAAGLIWQESIKSLVEQHNPLSKRADIRIYLTSHFEVPGSSSLPVQMLAIVNQGSKHSEGLEIVIQMQKGDISGLSNFRITGVAKVIDLLQTETSLSFKTPRLAQNTAIYVTMYQVVPIRSADVRVSDETRTIFPSEIIQLQP